MTGVLQPDVSIFGGGTVYLFSLNTTLARAWVNANVSIERQMFGAALVVEHRYAASLVCRMQDDGLIVADEEGL